MVGKERPEKETGSSRLLDGSFDTQENLRTRLAVGGCKVSVSLLSLCCAWLLCYVQLFATPWTIAHQAPQGFHSLCPGSHVTALFIWFRFISRWSSGRVCVCFLSPEIECPSSFPFLYLSSAFLHLFLLIPSLFFIYFFSWCTLLYLQATGTYSIGHADFCNYLVKDTYTHAYSHVLCPSPSTHSSVLHASLVSPY